MNIFIKLGIWILSGVYKVASWSFQIFIILSSGVLLESEDYELLIQNSYVLLGVVMLFVIAFSLLKGMVNPEDMKKGTEEVKKIIINLVSSVLIVILLPVIFAFGFDFQSAIMNRNTIGAYFGLGSINDSNIPVNNSIKTQANIIVNGVWTAFFNVNLDNCSSYDSNNVRESIETCQTQIDRPDVIEITEGNTQRKLTNFYDTIQAVNLTGSYNFYNNFDDAVDSDDIDFNFLLSLAGGLILLYIGVSYCFDMALRMVKLIFYQIIAPIPVFLRIIPNTKFSDMFKKWCKVTLACYFEIYIRVIAIYFCIYLCTNLLDSNILSQAYTIGGGVLGILAQGFLYMGIVIFMKRAPKLISEVTGIDSGNMKLGLKDKFAEGGGFVAGAALGSLATTGIRNATNQYQRTKRQIEDARKKGKLENETQEQYEERIRKIRRQGWISGTTSVLGGLGSGFIRGGKAGVKAKSFKDMKNASSTATQAAIDARTKRTNYRAAHSTGEGFWSDMYHVATGHISDAGQGALHYMGFNNIEQLKRENYSMDTVKSTGDKYDTDTDSFVDSALGKGKTQIDIGDGESIDLTELAKAKREYDNARARGELTAEIEEAYSRQRKNVRLKLQNATLISEEKWKKLDDDIRANLADLRVDAVKYKGVIRNNAALDALASSGIVGADFAEDRDFVLGVSTTKEVTVYEEEEYEETEEYDTNVLDQNGKPIKGKRTVKRTRTVPKKKEVSVMDTTKTIDDMGKAMKRNKGENDVRIAQQQQQKYEEKK